MFENTSAQEVALVAKKKGTNIDYKWDQSSPGGRGTENQQTRGKVKTKRKYRTNMRKYFWGKTWGGVLKGRRAQRLGVYCGIMNNCDKNDIKNIAPVKVYKTETGPIFIEQKL